MTATRDLKKLAEISQLMLDHRLGQLRKSAEELDRSRMQLSQINAAALPAADLATVTAQKVMMSYERWADVRRSELNLVIAQKTAEWMDSRAQAQTAFGRVQALRGLASRLGQKP